MSLTNRSRAMLLQALSSDNDGEIVNAIRLARKEIEKSSGSDIHSVVDALGKPVVKTVKSHSSKSVFAHKWRFKTTKIPTHASLTGIMILTDILREHGHTVVPMIEGNDVIVYSDDEKSLENFRTMIPEVVKRAKTVLATAEIPTEPYFQITQKMFNKIFWGLIIVFALALWL